MKKIIVSVVALVSTVAFAQETDSVKIQKI